MDILTHRLSSALAGGFDGSLRLTGQLAPFQGAACLSFGLNSASAGTIVTAGTMREEERGVARLGPSLYSDPAGHPGSLLTIATNKEARMTIRPEQPQVSLYVDRSLPNCWIVRDQ